MPPETSDHRIDNLSGSSPGPVPEQRMFPNGADEGFLAVITSSEVLYSTVFGWTGGDMPTSMARDARGDVFIAGTTTFPHCLVKPPLRI
ncbi:MAG: hypothetical protein IPI29_06470 [Ignavibacteria bacterium]|nr:hypothetical protein [Ignavibacteria bacterium]